MEEKSITRDRINWFDMNFVLNNVDLIIRFRLYCFNNFLVDRKIFYGWV
jgi:hypothetical protein